MRSSCDRWGGAHAAVLLAASSPDDKSCGLPLAIRAARTRRCFSRRRRGGESRAVVVWLLGRRARGAATRGVVAGGNVGQLSFGHWGGAHAAVLLAASSPGSTSCGRRLAAAAAPRRRCCSRRRRRMASRAVVGWPLGRRAGGAAARRVVAGWKVVRPSFVRLGGEHAALPLAASSRGGTSCGRPLAIGAAHMRRCCSRLRRRVARRAVVGWPLGRHAGGAAARGVVAGRKVVRSLVGR